MANEDEVPGDCEEDAVTTTRIRTRRTWVGVAVALVALVALSGCGDDDASEAQPGPDPTLFVEGDFGDLPLPPLAEPAGERSEVDDVVTRTWFVRNQTPEQVLAFYEDWFADDGVEALEAPAPAGEAAWGAIWPWRDRELHVSATETTTVAGDEVEEADVVSQLSLELWPEGSADNGDDPVGGVTRG